MRQGFFAFLFSFLSLRYRAAFFEPTGLEPLSLVVSFPKRGDEIPNGTDRLRASGEE